jgi:galactose mutarotase-like enzyme
MDRMFTIENSNLKIIVSAKGAELQSVFHKGHQLEYLWDGDPAYWAKRSPLLFPIVGALKSETYYYKDKPYHLGRHGFARDMEFEVEDRQFDSIRLVLNSNEETLQKFPFIFQLWVSYLLKGDTLQVLYSVKNPSGEEMYFSIGGHPAFRVPLQPGTAYTDYQLLFGQKETEPRWPISKDGLIETKPDAFLRDQEVLPLGKGLFTRDALVFKGLASSMVSLRSDKTPHGLDFNFSGFPFLGIWAAPNADFVCIEPWCGIADSVDTDQQLKNKEGINRLAPGETFERTWSIKLY